VGTSLSSGLDSSMVLAEARAQGHRAYEAFTAGSDDPRIDETLEASRFAATQGSRWHSVWAHPSEFAAVWDRMTWHLECPVPGTSLYGQWKVFEAARARGIVVMLDGQGGDEILGGYNKFVASILLHTITSRPHRVAGPIRGFVRQVGSFETFRTAGYRYLGRLGQPPKLTAWLRPGLFEGERAPRVRVTPLEMRLQDIRRWSLPSLLAYADRNAMAHSVEVRLPYLEPTLVALTLAMPDDVVFRDGWTKWPLRKTLAARGGMRPAWSGGKRWFALPQRQWLRDSLRPDVRRWLDAPHAAWELIGDGIRLRQFQTAWQTGTGSYAWDDQIFKMVALDRFLHVWFPR
jgi:asparagine synthase (glutamine-hydrolysing)